MVQLQVEKKCVPCYAVPENTPMCLVFLLDKYFDKLSLFAFENDVLYCRPKASTPTVDCVAWYEAAPVGKNKLGNMVKEMCIEGNVAVKTNHSLRATGASSMFQNNVPEKIIQNTTGHRSLEALRKYEKTSVEQHQAVSKALMSAESEPYQKMLQKTMDVNVSNNQHVASMTKENRVSDGIRSIFGNLTNCSLGNVTINIHLSAARGKDQGYNQDEEFDNIAKLVDL